MISMVFGGLASEASGGSFEDGAMQALFTHLFNDTYEVSLSGNLGSGPAVTGGVRLVFDDEWNVGLQKFKGGGIEIPSISGVVNITKTNAKTLYDLEGFGLDVTLEAGEGIVVELGGVAGGLGTGSFYTGKTLGIGLGLSPTVISGSAYGIVTKPIGAFNVKDAAGWFWDGLAGYF